MYLWAVFSILSLDPKAVLTRVKIFKNLLHVLKIHKIQNVIKFSSLLMLCLLMLIFILRMIQILTTVKICCMILAPGIFVIILPVYFTEKLNQVIIVQ